MKLYTLRVSAARFVLRVSHYGLRIINCELRIMNC